LLASQILTDRTEEEGKLGTYWVISVHHYHFGDCENHFGEKKKTLACLVRWRGTHEKGTSWTQGYRVLKKGWGKGRLFGDDKAVSAVENADRFDDG